MRIRDYVGATLLKFDVKKFCQYANSRLAILLKFDSKKKKHVHLARYSRELLQEGRGAPVQVHEGGEAQS